MRAVAAAYAWTCSACGASNAKATTACSRCACPFAATARDVDRHRAAFLAAGGTLEAGAADLATPGELVAVVKCLLVPLGIFLFGTTWFRTMETPGSSLMAETDSGDLDATDLE